MRLEGLDITSRPSRKKPLTRCRAVLEGKTVRIEGIDEFAAIPAFFEALTAAEPPRRIALDAPLGMPRPFWDWLGFSDWESGALSLGTREEWVARCGAYRGPNGEKELFRPCDRLARACSPMKCFYIPVGRMFHLVAPALAASSVSVLPHRPTDSRVEAVEAYPTHAFAELAGTRSYKSDLKDTDAKREARLRAVERLANEGLYGFRAEGLPKDLATDPKADRFDAVLCAFQAARSLFIPIPEVDPVEGWIAGL
ncbi:hypothetical protein BH11ARM2_BH11ARM2_25350 [soil metagenome]